MIAKLSNNVTFISLTGDILVVPKGTEVFVDIENMIASADGWHFDVSMDDICTFH